MVAGQSCLRRGEPGGGLAITMGLGNGTHQTFRQLANQLQILFVSTHRDRRPDIYVYVVARSSGGKSGVLIRRRPWVQLPPRRLLRDCGRQGNAPVS